MKRTPVRVARAKSVGGLEALSVILSGLPANLITFANITVAKSLESKLRDKHTIPERHVAEQDTKLELKKRSEKP